MYLFLIFLLLSISNVYVIWLLIELAFIFFLLFIINNEAKNTALVIYFFFQRFCSLILFILLFYDQLALIFTLLIAKLGLFPFFYWLILVSIKVRLLANFFILIFQKLPSLWLFWLIVNIPILLVYFVVYLNLFFVMINLIICSDLWLLLIYSSISNTRLLIINVYGSYYFVSIFIYLCLLFSILRLLWHTSRNNEILIVLFFFLTVPPFFLFFIKLAIISSLEFSLKLIIYIFIFDVLILLYYFRLIFTKFILFDNRFTIYIINFLTLMVLVISRNCVTLVIFY